jgi:RimJ/RimL family protein N-acetyltransferase
LVSNDSMMRLRETFTLDDVDWITEACQDPEIQRWTLVPRPYGSADARYFIEHPELELRRWVIEHDERAVGVIGVHGVNDDGDAEVGYWIAPWGRGARCASGALDLVAVAVADDASIRALTARIAVGNVASRRTAERAGFVEVARIEGGCRDGDDKADAILYRRAL